MISEKISSVKGYGRFLAIDHGSKYLGLALADERINIAMPFGVIANRGEEYVLTELKKIISEKNIVKIIIGRPLALSGNVTEQTEITDQFVVWLKSKTTVPIEVFDERFTTKMSATTNYRPTGDHPKGGKFNTCPPIASLELTINKKARNDFAFKFLCPRGGVGRRANIRITNQNKKNNAEGHDSAAAIFLQDYLERQKY